MEIKKSFILFIFLITIALFTIHADSNGIWTYPRDVTPGVFGEDESSNPNENYTFNNVVYFNQPLTTNQELITNSRITANDVFYSTSNIGIGVINPTNRLEVNGNIESNQLIDSNDNSYLVNPNGVSNMYRIVADAYFSPGSTAYYVNPSGTSRVGVINANTLQIGGQHTDNRYVNEGQSNSISNSMLQNNAVTSTKILDNSITSSDILDGTISGTDLVSSYRSGNVYDSRFVNEGQSNSISNVMLQNNAVTSAKIADNSITAADLGANSVGSSEIATNSVGADELSSAYQSGSAYDGRFVNENQVNSVNSNMVIDNSITSLDIQNGTITLDDLNIDNLDNVFAKLDDIPAVSSQLDFRICGQLGDGGSICSYTGQVQCSEWISEGGDWSNWISDGNGYDPDCVRLKIETRFNTYEGPSIPTCSGSDKALGWDGSTWICNSVSTSGGGLEPNNLVFEQHSSSQCTALGGEVITDSSSNEFCRFDRATCPAGWSQYQQWSTSIFTHCPAGPDRTCIRSGNSCDISPKSWSNSLPGTCTSTSYVKYGENNAGDDKCRYETYLTCSGTISQIGCY